MIQKKILIAILNVFLAVIRNYFLKEFLEFITIFPQIFRQIHYIVSPFHNKTTSISPSITQILVFFFKEHRLQFAYHNSKAFQEHVMNETLYKLVYGSTLMSQN
jgi:hypothetical protein